MSDIPRRDQLDGATAFAAEAEQADEPDVFTEPVTDPEVLGTLGSLSEDELEAELRRRRTYSAPADDVTGSEQEPPDDDPFETDPEDEDAEPLPKLPDGQFWDEDPATGELTKFGADGWPVWDRDTLIYGGVEWEVEWPTNAQIAIFQGVGARTLTPEAQTNIILGYMSSVLSPKSFNDLLRRINSRQMADDDMYTLLVTIGAKAAELRQAERPTNRRDRRAKRKAQQDATVARVQGAEVRTAAQRQRALESAADPTP